MKSGNRFSREQTTRVSTRPSSVASAWTGAPTDHERRKEVEATKDVADIVTDLLDEENRPSAGMVLQCLEVVLMKLHSESPARLAAEMDRLLLPVATSTADEIQAGKQHRPRLLKEVEELQERLRENRTALTLAERRRSEQDVQHYRLTERSNQKLEEGLKQRDLEEEKLRSATDLYQTFQKKFLEQAEKRSKEHWTQRQLILHETEALTTDLSRLRREYEQEKHAVRKLTEEVQELTHKHGVGLHQVADLQEMEELQGQLEAKRAALQDEMQLLLGQGPRSRTTMTVSKPT